MPTNLIQWADLLEALAAAIREFCRARREQVKATRVP